MKRCIKNQQLRILGQKVKGGFPPQQSKTGLLGTRIYAALKLENWNFERLRFLRSSLPDILPARMLAGRS